MRYQVVKAYMNNQQVYLVVDNNSGESTPITLAVCNYSLITQPSGYPPGYLEASKIVNALNSTEPA